MKNITTLVLACLLTSVAWANNTDSWIVYYADKAAPEKFLAYDLIAFDALYYPPLKLLQEADKTLLGYISLGEVEEHRPYFKAVKAQGILLQENPFWPDSYYVDVRNPLWAKRVIETLVPDILDKGFDGIIIDTMDNPAELERQDPVAYRGMTEAGAQLIKLIRLNYPDIIIMLNRGYEILPRIAEDINISLGESVYADYNFANKTYQLVESALYQQQVDMLQQAQKINPELLVYTLDYWYPEDIKTRADIYAVQEKNGFHPYVATIALDEIIEKP